MRRNHFDVRLTLGAPALEPGDPEDERIDERELERIVRQALWGAEDGDDVTLIGIRVSVIDTDIEDGRSNSDLT